MAATSTPPDISGALEKTQYFLRTSREIALRESGLTAPQYAALAALVQQSGLTAAALARRCYVTPQTMTGIVANLTSAGLIVREPDPENLRAIRLRVTETGLARFARARIQVEAIAEEMLRDIDRAEREALADLLAQCAEALAQRLPQRRTRRGI
jgi:DNA-binding MarR family transcriptional regulator